MICVANVGKIERSGVEALEKYAKEGGGVLFVTGPLTRGEHVTQDLYRNGKGLFPLPLDRPETLVVDPLDNTPDVQSEEHYVFHNMDHRVENISKIFVKQYFAVSAALEGRERSFRGGHHAAPQRRPAVGGEELRPRAGAGLPFHDLGPLEQLVQQ